MSFSDIFKSSFLENVSSVSLLDMGIGFLCLSGGGMLLWAGLLLVTKAIPAFVKWCIKIVKKIFRRKGE